jgi:hypothetical protein
MHIGYCTVNNCITVVFLCFVDWASSLGEIVVVVVVDFEMLIPVPITTTFSSNTPTQS